MPDRPKHANSVFADLGDAILYDHSWLAFWDYKRQLASQMATIYADLRPFCFEPTPNNMYLALTTVIVNNQKTQLLIDPVVLDYIKPPTINNGRASIRLRDCQFNNRSKMYRLPRSASQPELGQFLFLHHVWPFYQQDKNWATVFGLDPEKLPLGLPRRSLVETLELYRASHDLPPP